ncbi:Crp/Fnr family transcriptional regulator [candidate division KSB1 bacterium]
MAHGSIISKPQTFKKGETIFREGDIGNEMYILKAGKVEVVKSIKDEELILATLDVNSFFGEMALFGDKHRSATIRAVEDCTIVPINKLILDQQLKLVPDWFVAIMRTLVLRLKDTNKRLKSRYPINLEYSLIKLFFWVCKEKGTHEKGGLKTPLAPVVREVQNILGVSKDEVMAKLKDFSFVQMIKFSENTNEIFIPDVAKIESFLLFLQGKYDKKTRTTGKFADLQSDEEKMIYFERIYRLLARKKGSDGDT